jgi:hypothetical protein
MEAQNKDYNVNVIHSVWHRLKKGYIESRDLDPKKTSKVVPVLRATPNPSQAAPAAPATRAVINTG